MRRPRWIEIAPALLVAALVSACTPASCDPNQTELFSGIGCQVSGSYAARETALRNNLAASQANELEQQAASSRASADEANVAQELEQRRRQLALLDGRLQAMQREIDAARQRQDVDQGALGRAQAHLAQLRAQRAQVTPQSDDAQLRALEAPTRALGDELRHEGL